MFARHSAANHFGRGPMCHQHTIGIPATAGRHVSGYALTVAGVALACALVWQVLLLPRPGILSGDLRSEAPIRSWRNRWPQGDP